MFDEIEGKNTRERVLQTLLLRERCTINDLADAVDINPISVRHHISRLEAEGLVESGRRTPRCRATQRLSTSLPKKDANVFPSLPSPDAAPARTAQRDHAAALVEQLFTQMAQDMASDHKIRLEASAWSSASILKQLLQAKVLPSTGKNTAMITKSENPNCPYYHVGQNHPEVCSVDQTLISNSSGPPCNESTMHAERRRPVCLPDIKRSSCTGELTHDQHNPRGSSL